MCETIRRRPSIAILYAEGVRLALQAELAQLVRTWFNPAQLAQRAIPPRIDGVRRKLATNVTAPLIIAAIKLTLPG